MFDVKRISPIPKLSEIGEKMISLGSLGNARFYISCKADECDLVKSALGVLTSVLNSKLFMSKTNTEGDIEISLEISEDVPEVVTKNADQAYSVIASGSNIRLIGYSALGLNYAVNTFLQTLTDINGEFFVPEMEIIDFPDRKTRGHFIETRYGTNLMKLEDWKAAVDNMASMKLNQLVVSLYGCWCIQYDGEVSEYVFINIPEYPLLKKDVVKKYYSPKKGGWVNEVVEVPMAKEDFFGELIAYGKTRGVEVLPLWNSLGHNTLIPTKYPETAPIVDGEPSRVGFCVSSPKTYEMLFNIYDHIIDNYLKPNGITSFHIGLDEIGRSRALNIDDVQRYYYPWCQCPECAKMTKEEQMVNHGIKLISFLKSRGIKNVYMYNDLWSRIIPDPTYFAGKLREHDLFDVTVVDWWSYDDKFEKLSVQDIHPEIGVRSTVKPWNAYYHWNLSKDAISNVYLMTKMGHEGDCEGVQSYASWDTTCDINHRAIAEYSWSFEATGEPDDFRRRYAAYLFPNQSEKALRAFEIYASLKNGNFYPESEDDEEFGIGTLIRNKLAYYFYSYVAKDMDYPRNFPGEAMVNLLAHRELTQPKLIKISEELNEAYEIFTELRSDPTGDTALARRYAAELRNYRDIVDDYLALYEIHDITTEGITAENIARIAEIAKERKLTRYELMAEMEDFKEEYLHASHLRNQSIFMQFFSDLEDYAENTPTSDFKLDVCDMRGFASKAFYDLR